MANLMKRFVKEEEGMEFLEWAIVAILFAVAAAGVFSTFASTITTKLGNAQTVLP